MSNAVACSLLDSPPAAGSGSSRVASLDAFRGFVMIVLAFQGFGIAKTAANFPENPLWKLLGDQFEHVPWVGCAFWDLIQPAFMFLVGVSLPFSCAKRLRQGETFPQILRHVVWRSLILILLGIVVSVVPKMLADGNWHWNYHLVNVLTQIGLGYTFLFLLWDQPRREQWIVSGLILSGYWAWFASSPLPPKDFDYPSVGVKADWPHLEGFLAHWDKNTNVAAFADRSLLNALPRREQFEFNDGGYCTLNFIPSLVTMLFGLMTGEFLQRTGCQSHRIGYLIGWGCAGLAAGIALDYYGICPLVKRIWTPGWTLFSTGASLLMLAGFHVFADVLRWKWLCFPLQVAGANSILLYVVSQFLNRFYGNSKIVSRLCGGTPSDYLYGPMLESCTVGMLFWLMCWVLYRKRIFIRI